jgi:hypothetical protein
MVNSFLSDHHCRDLLAVEAISYDGRGEQTGV